MGEGYKGRDRDHDDQGRVTVEPDHGLSRCAERQFDHRRIGEQCGQTSEITGRIKEIRVG